MVIHEIGIGVFLLLSTFAVNIVHGISEKIEEIRIHIAKVNAQSDDQRRRIKNLEDELRDLRIFCSKRLRGNDGGS
jgi:chaperonin cofactor prefoldin